MASVAQVSMTRGEVSPQTHERVDVQFWVSALKTCRNFFPLITGGVKNRPGTKFVAEVKDSADTTRLVPFQFNEDQSNAMELGDAYVRFHTGGGQVVYSSGPSVGQPVEVAAPWTSSQVFDLGFAQSADVVTFCHEAVAPHQLSRFSSESWTLEEAFPTSGPWAPLNLDVSKVVAVDTSEGAVCELSSFVEIFPQNSVGQLFYLEQRNYTAPWEPGKSFTKGELCRSDGKYYKARNTGTTGPLRPTHYADVWSDGGVEWEYLHSGFGVVRITSVALDGKSAEADVISRVPDNLTATVAGTVVSIFGITKSNGYALVEFSTPHGLTDDGTANVAVTFEFLGTQTVQGTYSYTIKSATTVLLNMPWGFAPEAFTSGSFTLVSQGSVETANGTWRWKFGAWGGDAGFPSLVDYHQGRRVYAGSPGYPQTVWTSRVDAYDDFSSTVPIADDDGVTVTLASSRVNQVRSMLSLDRLLVLTAGAEWVVGGDAPLTPSTLQAKVQGYRGSAKLRTLGVGDSALFVQTKGQIVRDLNYVFSDNRYTGIDLTALSGHLFEGRSVVDWAYQQHPYSHVWLVMDDGSVLTLTYLREQEVVGWARHDFGGSVESVCCVSEGSEDAVYFIVRRIINGQKKRYVERLHTREITDIRDVVFTDSSLQFDGYLDPATGELWATTITLSSSTPTPTWDDQDFGITATSSDPIFTYPATTDVGDQIMLPVGDVVYRLTVSEVLSATEAKVVPNREMPETYRNSPFTGWGWARNTISGLSHLEGEVVAALGDGFDLGTYTVSSGSITLEIPSSKVTVGLPYSSDLETLSINTTNQETLSNKKKAIYAVRMRVLESSSVSAGRTLDEQYQFKAREQEFYDVPTRLQDGLVEVAIPTPWGDDGSVAVRHTAPLPITIVSIMPEVEVGGV